ncbi:MAG: hypothetical protein ACC742_09870 [Thermoanaerobaculales bacterium]
MRTATLGRPIRSFSMDFVERRRKAGRAPVLSMVLVLLLPAAHAAEDRADTRAKLREFSGALRVALEP